VFYLKTQRLEDLLGGQLLLNAKQDAINLFREHFSTKEIISVSEIVD